MNKRTFLGSNIRMTSLSIVIPVYNPDSSLLENLRKLEQGNPGSLASVILVDDKSTNDVPQKAEALYPQLTRIVGNGSLWWGGGICLGMEAALAKNVDVIFWLNHDCMPDAGSIEKMLNEASKEGVGCVSAWCYCRGDDDFPVNPGFKKFQPIERSELLNTDLVEVDGTNGNFVAINAKAVRKVGLPQANRHPHYGDGPYLWKLHAKGFCNFVKTSARAGLDREFERCISERDHSSLWSDSLFSKMKYYWFSMRSKFHWKNKFWDSIAFHGWALGVPSYFLSQLKLFKNVVLGHLARFRSSKEERIENLLTKYKDEFPPEKLRASLEKLATSS